MVWGTGLLIDNGIHTRLRSVHMTPQTYGDTFRPVWFTPLPFSLVGLLVIKVLDSLSEPVFSFLRNPSP